MILKKISAVLILSALSFLGGILYEQKQQSECKLKEIKNVSYRQKQIWASPPARKSELLELMRRGLF